MMKLLANENFPLTSVKYLSKKGYKPKAGVIFLRWDDFFPIEPGKYLYNLFKSGNFQFDNMLTVISESNFRQRKF